MFIVWNCQGRLFLEVLCGQERKQIPFQDVLRWKILTHSAVLEMLEKNQKVIQNYFAVTNSIAPSLLFFQNAFSKKIFILSICVPCLVFVKFQKNWKLERFAVFFPTAFGQVSCFLLLFPWNLNGTSENFLSYTSKKLPFFAFFVSISFFWLLKIFPDYQQLEHCKKS